MNAPFTLPLSVHPETDYVVIDADGAQVASCWPPGLEWDTHRERSIRVHREAAQRAESIVRACNGYAEMREIAQELADGYGVDHTWKCVQSGKPLMETAIGGDIPCTCGLSDLVNRAHARGAEAVES